MSESQAQTRAEEIARVLLSAAENAPRHQDDIVTSAERRTASARGGGGRYWQIRADLELAQDSPVTPPEVAEEMLQRLREDGWGQVEERPESGRGVDATLTKREAGGIWTVVLGAWDEPQPTPQVVYFWVVSPVVDH